MPIDLSHFSMVGFQVDMSSPAGFARAAAAYLPACAPTMLSAENILCVVLDPSGGQMRFALRKRAGGQAELVTVNPAFSGAGRASVEIEADVSDPNEKPFEITLTARFAGEKTPLVFDVADPTEAARLAPGTKITIDLAAFSFEPNVYSDEAAFLTAQSGAKIAFAPNSFIPSGMFQRRFGGQMPNGNGRPLGYADFAGAVVKAELRTNKTGHGRFWWALVKTYADATIDVVLDPSTVHHDIKPGSIIAGRFWLSAHVAPATPA